MGLECGWAYGRTYVSDRSVHFRRARSSLLGQGDEVRPCEFARNSAPTPTLLAPSSVTGPVSTMPVNSCLEWAVNLWSCPHPNQSKIDRKLFDSKGLGSLRVPTLPIASSRKVSQLVSREAGPLRLTHNDLTHMLTDTKIRALKPRSAAYRVADTNGLVIEVRPVGSKAWR